MKWVLIALLPPFLWAISNIVTKVIRTKHIKSSLSYTIIGSSISSLLLAGILFKPITFRFELIYLLPIFCGILLMLQYLFYIKALSLEDVSTLVPFFNFDPLMVLLLSTIFLNEILIPRHYLAFALLASGGILITIKKRRIHFSRGIMLILASALVWSVYSVIIKFVLGFIDSWTAYMLVRSGVLLALLSLIAIKGIREMAIKEWAGLNNKAKGVLAAAELSSALGVLFIAYASSMAAVSLVTVIGGLQPIFVLLIAAVLSFKFPQILREELNKKVIVQKSIAIALMIAGLALIV